MATTFLPHPNGVTTTLQSSYTAGSGSLVLATGTGSRFGTTFPIRVTVAAQATYGTPSEVLTIFDVIGRSNDTLTGVAASEGTTDRNYAAGDRVEVRWTNGMAAAIEGAVNALEAASASVVPAVAQGRISTSSSLAIPADAAAATSLYYVRHAGDKITLWDSASSAYVARTIKDASSNPYLAFTLSPLVGVTNVNVDLFLGWNGTAVVPSLATWSGDLARSGSGLYSADGMYFADSTKVARYVGTVRCGGTLGLGNAATFPDTHTLRFVWNLYNQVQRPHWYQVPVAYWNSTGTGSFVSWAGAGHYGDVQFVIGLDGGCQPNIQTYAVVSVINAAGGWAEIGISIDESTSTLSPGASTFFGFTASTITTQISSIGFIRPGIGYHWLSGALVQLAGASAQFFGQGQCLLSTTLWG